MKVVISQRCGLPAVRQPMPTKVTVKRSHVVARAIAQDMPEGYWDAEETDAQVFDRVVQVVAAKDIKQYTADGWTVLDVRPENEVQKVHVADAVEVPLFCKDTSLTPISLFKRWSAFGMCGWWLGAEHMVQNENFLATVQSQVPVDTKVVVACQQGLRSKAAASTLVKAGYNNVAWVQGGLNSSKAGDVPSSDGKDVRYAGIGGMSEMLHWTPLQNEDAGPLGGWRLGMAIFSVFWLVNIVTLSYELSPMLEKLQAQLPF